MNIIFKNMTAACLLMISVPVVAAGSSSTSISTSCTFIKYKYSGGFTKKVTKPISVLAFRGNDEANKAAIGAHIAFLLGRKDLPEVTLTHTSCPWSCKITPPGDFDACTFGTLDSIDDIGKSDLES